MRYLHALLALAVISSAGVACGSATVALRPAQQCDGGNLDNCRSRCDDNEGRACYRLGWFHEQGQERGQDVGKAVDLYERACAADFAVACRALGMLYWKVDGPVKRDPKKAIARFQKACTLGLPEACPTRAMVATSEGKKPSRAGADGEFRLGADASTSLSMDSDIPDAPNTDVPKTPALEAPKGPSMPEAPKAPTFP